MSGGFGIPLLPALKDFLEPEQYATGNINDNVFLLGGEYYEMLEQGKRGVLLLCDIAAAFPSVSHDFIFFIFIPKTF